MRPERAWVTGDGGGVIPSRRCCREYPCPFKAWLHSANVATDSIHPDIRITGKFGRKRIGGYGAEMRVSGR